MRMNRLLSNYQGLKPGSILMAYAALKGRSSTVIRAVRIGRGPFCYAQGADSGLSDFARLWRWGVRVNGSEIRHYTNLIPEMGNRL